MTKTDPRLAAYADVDECNARSASRSRPAGSTRTSRGAHPRAERPVRRRRRPLHAGRAGPEVPPLRISKEYVDAWRAGATVQRGLAQAASPSSSPAAPPRSPCCTWRGRSSGVPSGRVGAGRARSRNERGAAARTSTGSRTALYPVRNGKSGRRRAMGAGRQALRTSALRTTSRSGFPLCPPPRVARADSSTSQADQHPDSSANPTDQHLDRLRFLDVGPSQPPEHPDIKTEWITT